MNKFASIVYTHKFGAVTYYTVVFDGNSDSEFLDFIKRHNTPKFEDQLNIIREWLKQIGLRKGAEERFFRFEAYAGGDARALPPRFETFPQSDSLRLYCMRVTNNIVILFNGGVKKARRAQDCTNVARYFYQANLLSKRIHQAITDSDIVVDDENGLLIIPAEFEIEI